MKPLFLLGLSFVGSHFLLSADGEGGRRTNPLFLAGLEVDGASVGEASLRFFFDATSVKGASWVSISISGAGWFSLASALGLVSEFFAMTALRAAKAGPADFSASKSSVSAFRRSSISAYNSLASS